MSAKTKIVWHDRSLNAAVRQHMLGQLAQASEVLASQVRRNISKSVRGVDRNSKGQFTHGYVERGHSLPGGFPHLVTGRLRQSVVSSVDRQAMEGIVGSNVEYAKFLEFGTNRMEPRTFLRRTLAELRPRITAILSKPMKQ